MLRPNAQKKFNQKASSHVKIFLIDLQNRLNIKGRSIIFSFFYIFETYATKLSVHAKWIRQDLQKVVRIMGRNYSSQDVPKE